jgi:uncharacterized coiled-coil protein SlyX
MKIVGLSECVIENNLTLNKMHDCHVNSLYERLEM